MKIRVVTYNIHKGTSFLTNKKTLINIKSFINSLNADLVFLQEVKGSGDKTKNFEAQYEYLADQIWPHYSYSQNATYQNGHHGNVILSKFPIKETFKVDISTNLFEQRGILFSKITVPPEKQNFNNEIDIYCLCVHLNLTHFGRLKQYKKICSVINEHIPKDSKIILAGDFNDWRQVATKKLTPLTKLLEAHHFINKSYAKTFPSFFPLLKLDRLYVSKLTPVNSFVIKGEYNLNSDHLPIVTDLLI